MQYKVSQVLHFRCNS